MLEWNDLLKQLPESPDTSSTIASWRRGLCGFVVTIDIGLAWQESCHHAGLKMSKPNPGSPKTKLCPLVAGILYIDSGRLFFVCPWTVAPVSKVKLTAFFSTLLDSSFTFSLAARCCKQRIAQYCQVKAFIWITYDDNFTLELVRLNSLAARSFLHSLPLLMGIAVGSSKARLLGYSLQVLHPCIVGARPGRNSPYLECVKPIAVQFKELRGITLLSSPFNAPNLLVQNRIPVKIRNLETRCTKSLSRLKPENSHGVLLKNSKANPFPQLEFAMKHILLFATFVKSKHSHLWKRNVLKKNGGTRGPYTTLPVRRERFAFHLQWGSPPAKADSSDCDLCLKEFKSMTCQDILRSIVVYHFLPIEQK